MSPTQLDALYIQKTTSTEIFAATASSLKLQGSNRVCLGSDYPIPLGDLEIGKFIEESDLSSMDKANIFHNSTLEWLDLDKKAF